VPPVVTSSDLDPQIDNLIASWSVRPTGLQEAIEVLRDPQDSL